MAGGSLRSSPETLLDCLTSAGRLLGIQKMMKPAPEVLDGKHKDNYDWPFLFQAAQHHLSLGPVYFLGSAQHDQQLLTVETRTVLAGQITRKNRKVGMKVAGLELVCDFRW